MYIHHVTRTQLYLDDAIHERLTALARRQGRSLSDLVREALAQAYGADREDERSNSLKAIEGLWKDRSDLPATAEYVRQLRRDTRSKRLRPN
jgi:plasmid stability protein